MVLIMIGKTVNIRRCSWQQGVSWVNILQSLVFIRSWRCIWVIILRFSMINNYSYDQEKSPKSNMFIGIYKTCKKRYGNRQGKEVPPPKSHCHFSAFPDDVFLNFRRCILIFFHVSNISQIRLMKI